MSAGEPSIEVGELVIEEGTREVRVAGRPIALMPKEYELLCALAADPRRVFTKEELQRRIWGREGSPRALDAEASRLRHKLDGGSRFVQNCWGVGYRLINP